FLRRHDVGELALGEVAPFTGLAEHVANNDIRAASLVERCHDIRPARTGAAGHQQHSAPCPPSAASFAPLLARKQLGSPGTVKTVALPALPRHKEQLPTGCRRMQRPL